VPPQFARVLGIAVMNQVFGISLPAPLPLLKTGEELTFRKRKREKTVTYKAAASGSKKSLIKKSYQEVVVDSKEKRFDFSKGFELAQAPKGKFAIRGAVSRNRLVIKVTEVEAKKLSQVGELEISPIRPWEFEFEKIRFEFQGQSDSLISVCWKALELYLSERNLKNDLVQLGGYYQYESNLRIKINFESKVTQKFVWNLLARSINEGIIGKSMKYDDVSDILELGAKELVGFMSDLRDLGFEIRNRNTNSQIPEDTLLIPYAFPTLNSRSVQLHKSVS
jgi:DNA (cytosine-5)-methyltransferase 1